jgi:enoyl-CoA hydratase/carnithine racemase
VTPSIDPLRGFSHDVRPDVPQLSIDGHVARIVLRRPDQHNAIEAHDVARLHAHLATVESTADVRVLILTGSGRATFCSGASLAQIESGEMTGSMFEQLADALASVRVPSICALNGSAFGGGVELAVCCDFRVGVEGSRIAVPAARLGLCYPLGGIRRYVAALGQDLATRLLVGAEELDASHMRAAGFLHALVPPGELAHATDELAARLASLAPLAVQAMKRLVRDVALGAVDDEAAAVVIARCAGSEDFREGVQARRERRPPVFRGL